VSRCLTEGVLFSRPMDEVDTENMNPEEIYNSFRKTSADIQSLSKLSNQFDEIRKERERYRPLHGLRPTL